MNANELFQSTKPGEETFVNRVAMAPTSRCGGIANSPNEKVATYYQHRSQTGLVITQDNTISLHQ